MFFFIQWHSWLGLSNTPTSSLRKCMTPSMSVLDMTKQSDDESPVKLELWVMQSTPSSPLLPGRLRPREVVPVRVLSIRQMELSDI